MVSKKFVVQNEQGLTHETSWSFSKSRYKI